jgi:hypothetical protein
METRPTTEAEQARAWNGDEPARFGVVFFADPPAAFNGVGQLPIDGRVRSP